MKTAAFVISLERSELRFQNAHRLLERLPVKAEVLKAVDGGLLSEEETARCYRRNQHSPAYPFELRPGEIGCFLSHRKAWKEIVQRQLDAALIVEDDLQVDEAQLRLVTEVLRNTSQNFSFVQLPVRPLPRDCELVHRGQSCCIVRPQITPLRTSAQWVTFRAAEQLLTATEIFDRPVDTFLQMHWITGVRLHAVSNSGVSDSTEEVGGSSIGGAKKHRIHFEKVAREIKRTRYRWKIARLSSQHASKAA